MGTLAAGIKDIFSTAKTTGTNVMLSGNDGTPDGHITMANLASVLGVPPAFYKNYRTILELATGIGQTYTNISSGDLNDYYTSGRYNIPNVGNVTNSPWDSGAFAAYMWVIGQGNQYNSIQIIAHNLLVNGVYIRSTRGGMNTWTKIL